MFLGESLISVFEHCGSGIVTGPVLVRQTWLKVWPVFSTVAYKKSGQRGKQLYARDFARLLVGI